MSLAYLFYPNALDLNCNEMTCNVLNCPDIIASNCINTCANEGVGAGIFDAITGAPGSKTANFKSLVAGGGITITSNASDLTIAAPASLPSGSPGQILNINGSGNAEFDYTLNSQNNPYVLNTGTSSLTLQGNSTVISSSGLTCNAPSNFTSNVVVGSSLTDSLASAGTNGQVLKSTGSAVKWQTQTFPVDSVFSRTGTVIAQSGDYNINQLAGVSITSPQTSQVLEYNGSNFVNSSIYTYTSTVFNSSSSVSAVLNTLYINGTTATYTLPSTGSGNISSRIMIACSQSVQCQITFGVGQFLVYNGTAYSNFTMNSPTGSVELICIGNNQWTFGSISGQWSSALLSFKSFNATMDTVATLQDTNIISPITNNYLKYSSGSWINSNIFSPSSSSFKVYVDQSGNDTTGDGTSNNPYLTITHAMSQITFASISNRVALFIGPGTWTDSFALKPNIFLVGTVLNDVRLSGTITLNDSGWVVNNDNRSGAENIIFTVSETFDFTIQSSQQGKLYFTDCIFNAVPVLVAFNPVNQVIFDYCRFFGGITQTGITSVFSACNFLGGPITLNSSTNAQCNAQFTGGGISGNVSATYTSSNAVILTLINFGIQGTLSISGASCSLYATCDSIPIGGVIIASGATLNYLNDTNSLQYIASNTAKWASPTTMSLQSAIDRIAAVVGNITPIP